MEKMEWKISVPIFKNTVILKQLGLALGIPFGIVALMIGLTSGKIIYVLYWLGLTASLFALTWLIILAVYRGKYEVEYRLDSEGALFRTQKNERKKNEIIYALIAIVSVLSRKTAATGAAILAQSREEVFLRWKSIRKVSFNSKTRTIFLKGGWMESMALFCTEENYPQVEQEIILQTKHLIEK